ncbi:MAG: cation:proton antiporter, partial [Halobaculum sp.]
MATPLLEAGALFAAAAVANAAADRLGIPAVPLYIVAGIVVNEFVAGRLLTTLVTDSEFVTVGAELGIVFLLFYLGVEFDFDTLVSGSDRIVRAGTADLVVNFGIGLLVGLLLFDSFVAAVVVAGVIYPSSSAIITRSLLELGWIANEESAPILGVLVFEDLVLAVYLVVVPVVLLSGASPAEAVVPAGIALGFILMLALGVRFGTAALARLFDARTSEAVTLRALGVLVLAAGGALALGASEAVA